MRVDYIFNGSAFSTYGVYVSKSNGLLGKPKKKAPDIYVYPGESGHIPDLANPIYEAREISLTCFITANSATALITTYDSFTTLLLYQTNVRNLSLKIDDVVKLTFAVYTKEITPIDKRFTEGKNVGTFTITFTQPQP